jgi:hypothetical protein
MCTISKKGSLYLPIELSRETRSWRGMIGIWSLCRSPMVGDSSVETTATQHCSHNLTRLFRTSAWRGYPNESHPTHHNCCITQVNWPMLFVHLYYPAPFIYNTFIHFHTLSPFLIHPEKTVWVVDLFICDPVPFRMGCHPGIIPALASTCSSCM